jgi:AraC-like DNA-binding protein
LQATIKNLIRSRRMLRSGMQHELPMQQTAFSISDNEFLARAIAVIKKRIADEEFSVDDLCSELGVSRSVLFRRIKAVLEISPSELILKTKLNYAVSLMNTTNFSISEIATATGFSNPKYFSTVFKKIYNKSPKDFQLEQKEKAGKQLK